ncbi:MAG: uL15 family ribosomal protein [Candidatus Micrarchaeota archaeon]
MARRHPKKGKKYLGNRSYGAGNIKNRRGKGSKGGTGRGGYHKQKWFHTITYHLEEIRSRHKGFSNPTTKKQGTISLHDIMRRADRGEYPASPGGALVVDLRGKNVKVLGGGRVPRKLEVTAAAFAKKAKEKIVAAGGAANAEM